MAHSHDNNDEHSCCEHSKNVAAVQTIDEMDFERGIWSAALYNDLDRLEKLCIKDQTNDLDNHGYSGLHYAARQGHFKACQILLKYGANVNAQTNGGSTSLHRAAMVGNVQICQLLLANHAKLEISDLDGKTPLHRAAENQHLDVAKLLLDKNKNLKMMVDKNNKKPFDYVVQRDNQDDDDQCTELKALLKAQPD